MRGRMRWAALGLVVIAAIVAAVVLLRPGTAPVPAAAPTAAPSASVPASTPTATPTSDPYHVDATAYDLARLPVVDAFALLPALPLDSTPFAPTTGELATPARAAVPVFAAPGQPPVAQLPQTQQYDGTTMPVVERYTEWIRVLLIGRQALPSSGVHGQLSGWLRTADVTFTPDPWAVHVDLAAHVVTVTNAGAVTATITDFGWGAARTPTPLGRTFVMTHDAPQPYTRGFDVVPLAVQSPTLDGFNGSTVAVTAFHYHDVRDGAVSNGCVRLNATDIATILALPYGTPVTITG